MDQAVVLSDTVFALPAPQILAAARRLWRLWVCVTKLHTSAAPLRTWELFQQLLDSCVQTGLRAGGDDLQRKVAKWADKQYLTMAHVARRCALGLRSPRRRPA